jgi:small-conductance mechanosensitive channel
VASDKHREEDRLDPLLTKLPGWATGILIAALAIAVAWGVHAVVLGLARRAARRTSTDVDDIILRRLNAPARWLLIVVALSFVQPGLALGEAGTRAWTQTAGLVIPALLGWMAVAVLGVAFDVVLARTDMNAANNLRARRRRTRAGILHRIGVFLVMLVAFCMMLMSIPSVRNIGVTLIASAGLAALAVGAAAQPALKNLIAGLQMAFTEPIRLDDVVIIDGEWGRIEEIRLTYVVVKIWDERRLVVPVSKFLEDSFQNWTRETSQIMGSVFWYLDPAADIPRLRGKLEELVRADPRWDGRFCNLQVTDAKPGSIEVRGLMTAKDAATAFDLRCEVREGLLAYIRSDMPEALARTRELIEFTPRPEAASPSPSARS